MTFTNPRLVKKKRKNHQKSPVFPVSPVSPGYSAYVALRSMWLACPPTTNSSRRSWRTWSKLPCDCLAFSGWEHGESMISWDFNGILMGYNGIVIVGNNEIYPLVISQVAMENCLCTDDLPIKILIFHSYIELIDGTAQNFNMEPQKCCLEDNCRAQTG